MDAVIAGAAGLVGLYVALRQEVRRSHELLTQRVDHVEDRLGARIDNLDSRLGGRIDQLDGRVGGVEASLVEVRADIRRVDQKIDGVRGELIAYLGQRPA